MPVVPWVNARQGCLPRASGFSGKQVHDLFCNDAVFFVICFDGRYLGIPLGVRQVVDNPAHPRNHGLLIAEQTWVDGWQPTRLL